MHTHIYFVTTDQGANIDPMAVQRLQFQVGRYNGDVEQMQDEDCETVRRYPLFSVDVAEITEIKEIKPATEDVQVDESLIQDMTDMASVAVADMLAVQIQNHSRFYPENPTQVSLTEMLEVFAHNKTLAVLYDVMDSNEKLIKSGKMNLQNQLKLDYNQITKRIN